MCQDIHQEDFIHSYIAFELSSKLTVTAVKQVSSGYIALC